MTCSFLPLKKHRWRLLGNPPRTLDGLPLVSIIPASAWCYSVPSLQSLAAWLPHVCCSTAGQFCPSPFDPGQIKHQLLFDDSRDGGRAKDPRASDPPRFISGKPEQPVAAGLQLCCWQLLAGCDINNGHLAVVMQDVGVHFAGCYASRSVWGAALLGNTVM